MKTHEWRIGKCARPCKPHRPAGWLHLELARRELLLLADARGQTLACESGELWLTEEGDADDRILRSGEAYTIRRPGRVVLSACRPARIALGGAP